MLNQTYNTYQAENSQQALRLLNKIRPDLCLIDVHLPPYLNERAELEGLTLMENIYEIIGLKIPVILTSRFPLPDYSVSTKGIPFLKKPFKISELISLIETLL